MLAKNELTDLSALYLSDALKSYKGVTALDFGKTKIGSRAGEYLAEALRGDYPIKWLSFKGNCLEGVGLRHILEAANSNENMKYLDLGYVSDDGLQMMTELLKFNKTLEEIRFKECKEKPFEESSKLAFVELLMNYTEIEEIKCKVIDKHRFKREIKSKLKSKKKSHKQIKKFHKRNHELILDKMVSQIAKIESQGSAGKMPVKNYFNNTFGNILNDAMYELQRKQTKFPDENEYFSLTGQI